MAIRVSTLDRAIAEAEVFLSAARTLREHGSIHEPPNATRSECSYDGGRLPAHVKRSSMELTNTLSRLRQGE